MNKKRLLSLLTLVFVVLSLATFVFATGEAVPTADAAASGEPAPWYAGLVGSPIPMLVAMFAIFYFLLIRPENKRKKETANMRSNLKVGDEITTIGGIIGRISKIKDEVVTIETTTDKNKIKITKWAVSSVNKSAKEKPVKEEVEQVEEE